MTVQILFSIIAVISILIVLWRKKFTSSHPFILSFVQSFLGLLFIFSGIVKGIDPKGTGHKMHEYFSEFSKDGFASFWDQLVPFDLWISVGMIVFELFLGIAIFVGWRGKSTSIWMLAINLFFLFLTGYAYLSGFCITKSSFIGALLLFVLLLLGSSISLDKKRRQALLLVLSLLGLFVLYCKISATCMLCDFNPNKMRVKDCGCFGDFMKLKPSQTFSKDILLTLLSIILVWFKNDIKPIFQLHKTTKIVMGFSLLAIIFCFYNFWWTEPMIDFRPYAIGNDIKKKMETVDPGEMENILVYKNKSTGALDSFTINNLPTDTQWQFSDRIDRVIREGIPAPIPALRFEDIEHNDITPSMLNDPNIAYWVVVYNIEKCHLNALLETIKPFAHAARSKGINIYMMCTKVDSTFVKEIGPDFDIVIADETPLKTMIRSNPGVLKVQNGIVLNKWHYRQFSEKKAGL